MIYIAWAFYLYTIGFETFPYPTSAAKFLAADSFIYGLHLTHLVSGVGSTVLLQRVISVVKVSFSGMALAGHGRPCSHRFRASNYAALPSCMIALLFVDEWAQPSCGNPFFWIFAGVFRNLLGVEYIHRRARAARRKGH